MKYAHKILLYLTLVFAILRLTNIIDWNWLWVLSPLLIVVGVLGTGLFVSIIIFNHYRLQNEKVKEVIDKLDNHG